MTDDTIRQLTVERAELIERLSLAYRLIGSSQLYVRWYGEDRNNADAAKLSKEMKAYFDGGLFGDKGKPQPQYRVQQEQTKKWSVYLGEGYQAGGFLTREMAEEWIVAERRLEEEATR